ncbi:MAG: proton-conducting transporter membrane subunit [Anaerolineales bacterium]
MSAPVIISLVTLMVFGLGIVLRHRPLASSVVTASGAMALALFALRAPIDQPTEIFGIAVKIGDSFQVLGRSLTLSAGNRAVVGFLFVVAGFVFGAGWAARPGAYFFPAGMVVVGAVVAALMISPFLYAAAFLEIAALAGVLLIAPPGRASIRGSERLLLFYTLAMLAILVTGWMLPSVGVTRATPELAARAIRLLALGFAVLILVPPFHIWLLDAIEESSPYAVVLLVGVLQSAGLFFMLRFLDNYEWLRTDLGLMADIRLVGAALIVIGGLFALAERSMARSVVYVLMGDLGVTLLAVSINTPVGYQLALGLSAVRVIGLAVWGLGISVLQREQSDRKTAALEGRGLDTPIASAAALVGLASLSGLPMTAGFPARWGLMAALAGQAPGVALLVIASVMAEGLACVKWLRVLLSPAGPRPTRGHSRAEYAFLGLGISLVLSLGLFPQLVFPWVVQALSGLKNLLL